MTRLPLPPRLARVWGVSAQGSPPCYPTRLPCLSLLWAVGCGCDPPLTVLGEVWEVSPWGKNQVT